MPDDEEETITVLVPAIPSAVVNGASNRAITTAIAEDLCEQLIGIYPWVLECDAVAIEQYCRAEARARLLDDYCMRKAEAEGPECVAPHMWSEASKAETNAMRAAEALGLTPAGRGKIMKDAGIFASSFNTEGVQGLRAVGAEIRRRRGA
jgi:hypothetical protein